MHPNGPKETDLSYKTIFIFEIVLEGKMLSCNCMKMVNIISISEHAKQWIGCLGKLLRDSAKDNLFQLNDNLDVSTVDSCYLDFGYLE